MLISLLKSKKTSGEFLRYLFVGGLAFLVDFGSLYLLTEYGNLHYLLSAAFAFLLGLSTNYFLSVRYVFVNRTVKSKAAEFSLFAMIGLVGLALNHGLIWAFTEKIALHYLVSKIIATIVVFLWNFFARKTALFK